MDAFQSYQQLQPYLSPGERVLWSGKPRQGIALSGSDIYLIPFSLLWGGFAFFWNFQVWTTFSGVGFNDDWLFKLWGLPFLAAGIYFIVGRFFHDAWVRRHLLYAVTNQRVLILGGSRSSKLTSRDIQALPMLELTEHRDRTGTLVFDSNEVGYSWFGRSRGFSGWTPNAGANAQFFRIQDPRRVYELIRGQSQA